MGNFPVPGRSGSLVNSVSPGTNVSWAQLSPPSAEYENPHPSLYSQSFHAPAITCPSGDMPRDSSLFAYRSLVTSTGGATVTFRWWGTEPSAGCIPMTAAPASERTATSLMIFTLTSLPPESRGGAGGAFPSGEPREV